MRLRISTFWGSYVASLFVCGSFSLATDYSGEFRHLFRELPDEKILVIPQSGSREGESVTRIERALRLLNRGSQESLCEYYRGFLTEWAVKRFSTDLTAVLDKSREHCGVRVTLNSENISEETRKREIFSFVESRAFPGSTSFQALLGLKDDLSYSTSERTQLRLRGELAGGTYDGGLATPWHLDAHYDLRLGAKIAVKPQVLTARRYVENEDSETDLAAAMTFKSLQLGMPFELQYQFKNTDTFLEFYDEKVQKLSLNIETESSSLDRTHQLKVSWTQSKRQANHPLDGHQRIDLSYVIEGLPVGGGDSRFEFGVFELRTQSREVVLAPFIQLAVDFTDMPVWGGGWKLAPEIRVLWDAETREYEVGVRNMELLWGFEISPQSEAFKFKINQFWARETSITRSVFADYFTKIRIGIDSALRVRAYKDLSVDLSYVLSRVYSQVNRGDSGVNSLRSRDLEAGVIQILSLGVAYEF